MSKPKSSDKSDAGQWEELDFVLFPMLIKTGGTIAAIGHQLIADKLR